MLQEKGAFNLELELRGIVEVDESSCSMLGMLETQIFYLQGYHENIYPANQTSINLTA